MNDQGSLAELAKLSVADRLRLMEELWYSLCEAPGKLDVPAWHRDELDRGLADDTDKRATARPWADVRADVLAGLRKP